MPRYVVCRPIEGISLNGNEYLLDDEGKVRIFESTDEVLHLFHMESLENLEAEGIQMEERKREGERD